MRRFVRDAQVILLGGCFLAASGCGEPDRAGATDQGSTAGASSASKLPAISASVLDASTLETFLVVPGKGDVGRVLEDRSAFELRSSGTDRKAGGDGDGGLVRVDDAIAAKLDGRQVRVAVELRASPENGSPSVRLMYSRPGAPDSSGWREFSTSADFQVVTFEYRVPPMAERQGPDMIAFWADPEGAGRGVQIRSVQIATVD